MPRRTAEIHTAHLIDVTDALRQYIEQGAPVHLETEYVAEDEARVTFTVDLRMYYPLLQELTRRRFPPDDTPPSG